MGKNKKTAIENIEALWNKCIEKDYLLYSLLIAGIIFKLIIFAKKPDLWWDSASYAGYGKFLVTFGQVGFFDVVRPVILPLLLGFGWIFGIDPINLGILIQITASTVSVYLIYRISELLFKSKRLAIISALILTVDPIIFNDLQHPLTEILAMCFALFAVFYFLKAHESGYENRYLVLAGAFSALAFLSRFTSALIGVALFIMIISTEKIKNLSSRIKKAAYYSIAVFIVVLPFLAYNIFLFKNPLYIIFRGIYEIGLSGQVMEYPLLFYFKEIPGISIILLLGFAGFFLLLKNWREENSKLLLMLFLIGILYHTFFVTVKVLRYSILFLPFLIILTAYCIHKAINHDRLLRTFIVLFLAFSVLSSLSLDITYMKYAKTDAQGYLENNYYNYFDRPEYKGAVVASTSPYPTALSDIRLKSLFIPNKVTLKEYEAEFDSFYVMFSSADNPCDMIKEACQKKESAESESFDYIKKEYTPIYNTSVSKTTHYIFQYKKTA